MSETIKDFTKSVIEKTNLFILLQIVWLVEFYVLAIFAGKTCMEEIFQVNVNPPEVIMRYSDKLIEWMAEYNRYIFILAIIMLFAGLSGSCFMHIGELRKYNLIYTYSDFGLYAGIWMLLIQFTYKIYEVLNAWFLIVPFLALLICESIKKARDWLKTKGITFGD